GAVAAARGHARWRGPARAAGRVLLLDAADVHRVRHGGIAAGRDRRAAVPPRGLPDHEGTGRALDESVVPRGAVVVAGGGPVADGRHGGSGGVPGRAANPAARRGTHGGAARGDVL